MYLATIDALTKLGIASNISKLAIDSPLQRGDAGVLSLCHYQGTSRTVMMICQCNRLAFTGKFSNLYIEDLVLKAGIYSLFW